MLESNAQNGKIVIESIEECFHGNAKILKKKHLRQLKML
jgi:hypothetical protein